MAQHIFLSYSRSDIEIMRRIQDHLRAEGLEVWTDENLIPGTPSWKVAIENALDNASCLVVILTPNSKNKSSWVRKELDYADAQDVRIFPILAKGDEKSSVPFGYITAQWVDIRQEADYIPAMQKLTFTLRAHLGWETLEQEQPAIPKLDTKHPDEHVEPVPTPVNVRTFPQGVAQAIMVLQNRTSKWWRRVDAVTRLGDLRDPVALPALKAFLDDTDLDVQRAAQNAIEQIVNATAEVKAVTPVSTTATALAEDETQPSVLTAEQTIEEARVARKAVKIVVTGPSAFLRRQFINSISEIDVLSTERAVSPQGETVSLDYGQIMVDDDLAIYLFGSPGEREYDFIWEVLSEGMLGFVVLVDSTQPNSFRSAKSILNNFAAYAPVPYIVAADNSFRADAWPLNDIGISLRLRENVKILSCASLDHDSVKNILLELIYLISETNDYDSV